MLYQLVYQQGADSAETLCCHLAILQCTEPFSELRHMLLNCLEVQSYITILFPLLVFLE